MADERTRVVVTGMGATTALGLGVDIFWERCLRGESGIAPIQSFDASEFDCTIGGEVRDFQPTDYMDRKAARRMARFSQLAVAATQEALEDAALDLAATDRGRAGIILGNGYGGLPDTQATVTALLTKGAMRIDPFFIPRTLPNMAAANVAMRFGILGYTNTVVTACAAATQAIGEAAEVIRRQAADLVVAGGTEAGFCALGLGGFAVMRALTSRSDDPTRASRPFDAERDGLVPAEGAAILIPGERGPCPGPRRPRARGRSAASAAAATPTTWSCRISRATAPCEPSAPRWKTPPWAPRRSTTSTPTAPRRR